MRRLATVMGVLLLLAAPAWAEDITGDDPAGDVYVVGVDMQEGLYSFFSSDITPGVMTVTNWDGSIAFQQEVCSGWYETMRIYNEQTVYLPENCQGEFHMSFATSAFDTGTRRLYLREPGSYCVREDMLPGLYILQNDGEENASVMVRDDSGEIRHTWCLLPGAQYTVLLMEGDALTMDKGCLLRSMTTERVFQEETSAYAAQGRYIMGMQMPVRDCTFTGREGDSFVRVAVPGQSVEEMHSLAPGEGWTLKISGYDTRELLVEMVNVDISWEQGDG